MIAETIRKLVAELHNIANVSLILCPFYLKKELTFQIKKVNK